MDDIFNIVAIVIGRPNQLFMDPTRHLFLIRTLSSPSRRCSLEGLGILQRSSGAPGRPLLTCHWPGHTAPTPSTCAAPSCSGSSAAWCRPCPHARPCRLRDWKNSSVLVCLDSINRNQSFLYLLRTYLCTHLH